MIKGSRLIIRVSLCACSRKWGIQPEYCAQIRIHADQVQGAEGVRRTYTLTMSIGYMASVKEKAAMSPTRPPELVETTSSHCRRGPRTQGVETVCVRGGDSNGQMALVSMVKRHLVW